MASVSVSAQPASVRESAQAGLDAIGQGGPVSPAYRRAQAEQSLAELERLAEDDTITVVDRLAGQRDGLGRFDPSARVVERAAKIGVHAAGNGANGAPGVVEGATGV